MKGRELTKLSKKELIRIVLVYKEVVYKLLKEDLKRNVYDRN